MWLATRMHYTIRRIVPVASSCRRGIANSPSDRAAQTTIRLMQGADDASANGRRDCCRADLQCSPVPVLARICAMTVDGRKSIDQRLSQILRNNDAP